VTNKLAAAADSSQELLYTVSKGRAHNQRDAPSQQAAKAAADAMVAMASTDSGIILVSSSSSSSSGYVVGMCRNGLCMPAQGEASCGSEVSSALDVYVVPASLLSAILEQLNEHCPAAVHGGVS
jgi:hypothetical protein